MQIKVRKIIKLKFYSASLFFSGNPLSMESLYDRDDSRSVHCFPSEIYGNRTTNNPYTTLKTRTYNPKQISSRIHRIDSYEYKKISFNI